MKVCTLRAVVLLALLLLAAPATSPAGIGSTPHNLGATAVRRAGKAGAGAPAIKAEAQTDEMCVFCHTPHGATAKRGLWSRELPEVTYQLYESSTTEAELQQPTGSSRLCLSCHDGRIAPATVQRGKAPPVQVQGRAVLGTDLSDDHPISFVYDHALANRRRELSEPNALPKEVKLDDTAQMQCTSCHDPHTDTNESMLVLSAEYSRLCLACHVPAEWESSDHAVSTATSRRRNGDGGTGATVAERGCLGCHRSHAAEHPERLLRAESEYELCLTCHDGNVAARNLRDDFLKRSAHQVDLDTDVHEPGEEPALMKRHVVCSDCHNAHQARSRSVEGFLPGPLTGVPGVDVGGQYLPVANFGYEVCLRCHGVEESPAPSVQRADNVTNTRLEIDSKNASYHPIVEVGRNSLLQGLIPPLTVMSRIACTSCHASDTDRGSGPHGSIYEPILAEEYLMDGGEVPESAQSYALCYRCHSRDNLLSERRSVFPHREHLGEEKGASCAVCHDAHGSRRSPHLINFMTRDNSANPVVTPSSSGRLEYEALAFGGRCYLTCHGKNHDGVNYPEDGGGGGGFRMLPGRR